MCLLRLRCFVWGNVPFTIIADVLLASGKVGTSFLKISKAYAWISPNGMLATHVLLVDFQDSRLGGKLCNVYM